MNGKYTKLKKTINPTREWIIPVVVIVLFVSIVLLRKWVES